MSHFHWIIDGLFVAVVALIWFMLGYQSLLFFLGHVYYRRTRHNAQKAYQSSRCRPALHFGHGPLP